MEMEIAGDRRAHASTVAGRSRREIENESPLARRLGQAVRRGSLLHAFAADPTSADVGERARDGAWRGQSRPTLTRVIRHELVQEAFGEAAPDFLRGRRVGVSAYTSYDGLGDIAAMAKMGSILAEAGARVELILPRCGIQRDAWRHFFSFLPPQQIFHVGDDDALCRLRALEVVLVWRGQRVGLQYGAFFRPDGRDEGIKVPALNILEYNICACHDGPDMVETGFSPHTIGHLVDDELASFACLSSARKEDLRQRIYARHRAPGGIFDASWPATRPSSVHLVYARQPLVDSIRMSAWFHGANPADLALVVVGEPASASAEEGIGLGSLPDDFDHLALFGPLVAGYTIRRPSREGGGGRKLSVWVAGQRGHETFLDLLKLSDFATVTGDQSLSEAISVGVPFAYAVPPHKAELAGVLGRSGRLSPGGRQMLMSLLGQSAGAVPTASYEPWRAELARWSQDLRELCGQRVGLLARVMRRIGGHVFDDCRRHFPIIERCVEDLDLDPDGRTPRIGRELELAFRALQREVQEI